MIAVLRWIFACALTVIVVAFALANRDSVEMVWSPVHEPAVMPLFLPVLTGVAFGFLSGGFMVWLNGLAARREQRRQKKIIRELEKQVEETAAKNDTALSSPEA